jgi:hypothetical protein
MDFVRKGGYKRLAAHIAAGGGLGYWAGTSNELYDEDSKFETKHKKVMSRINGTLGGLLLGTLTGNIHKLLYVNKSPLSNLNKSPLSLSDLIKHKTGENLKTKADLKQWYKKKAMAHHPDRHALSSDHEIKIHDQKFKDAQAINDEIERHPDFSKLAAIKLAVIKQEGLYADPGYQKVQKKYNDGNLEDKFQFHAYKRALDRAIYNYHSKQGH